MIFTISKALQATLMIKNVHISTLESCKIFSISRDCNKKHWNKPAEGKHEPNACILIPTLAGYTVQLL